MTKLSQERHFDIEQFWHSFGIWILTFELFRHWRIILGSLTSKKKKSDIRASYAANAGLRNS